MRPTCLAACLLVISNSISWAEPPAAPTTPAMPAAGFIVSIPKAIKGDVGQLVEVKAETGAELVTWKATEGLRIVNDDPPDPARKTILVHSAKPGVYALAASIPAEKGTRLAVTLVTIGQPKPPDPPPAPTFQSKLQDAFTADGGKPEQAALLAALYSKAATTTVRDPALTTAGQLLSEMQRAVKLLGLPAGSLAKTVRVIQSELDGSLPTVASTPLDSAMRDKIAAAFVAVAEALGNLK